MKIPFKVLTMTVAGSLLLTGAVTVTTFAQYDKTEESSMNMETISHVTSLNVTVKKFEEKTDLYTATMDIPVVSDMQDKSFEKYLNEAIENKVMARYQQLIHDAEEGLQEAKEGGFAFNPYILDVTYELKSAGSIIDDGKLSIVVESDVYMGGAHGTLIIDTYNVMNKREASPVTLKQMLGSDYKNKANKAIRKAIKQKPERFFPEFINEFDSVVEDQKFYIEKGKVVLVFQPGEISPHPVGVMEISVQ